MSQKEPVQLKMKFHEHYEIMWPFIKPCLFRAILAVLVSVPIGALDSVIALSLKPYMDIVVVEKSERSPVYIPFLIIAFTSLQGFLNYVATYLNTWVGTHINQDLKRHMFKKLMSMETSYFDENGSGVILQRFSSDCNTACSGLLDNLRVFVARFCSSFSLVCVLIYNSWQLAIIAVAVMFLAFLPLSTVKRRIKGTIQKSVSEGSRIFTNYNEAYDGNKTIAGYNLQNYMYEKFDATLKLQNGGAPTMDLYFIGNIVKKNITFYVDPESSTYYPDSVTVTGVSYSISPNNFPSNNVTVNWTAGSPSYTFKPATFTTERGRWRYTYDGDFVKFTTSWGQTITSQNRSDSETITGPTSSMLESLENIPTIYCNWGIVTGYTCETVCDCDDDCGCDYCDTCDSCDDGDGGGDSWNALAVSNYATYDEDTGKYVSFGPGYNRDGKAYVDGVSGDDRHCSWEVWVNWYGIYEWVSVSAWIPKSCIEPPNNPN